MGTSDWAAISKSILLTKPVCSSQIPTLIQFVKNFGGGVGSKFIDDLCVFHRKYAANERHLSDVFLEGLTNLVVKEKPDKKNDKKSILQDFKLPLLRFAILKTEYTCPDNKVSRGECKFITPSDMS